ncbi:putative cysteine-rich repeat secretory protein 7 [Miscanthus floridulus]|uniref:putative cysteine-rich repeat secretory protein 7 n=1 Tax=Miscanthus floridulus TaxID=154761 RepID=UPI003457983E
MAAGTETTYSTYLSNLKALAVALTANASTPSFVSGAVGQAPDAVYGFMLCRGDYAGDASCGDGLRKAFQNAVDKGLVCPFYKEVTIYYDQYMLRFSGDDVHCSLTNRPA